MYLTSFEVEKYLTIILTDVQREAMDIFLKDWALMFNTTCYINDVNPEDLPTIALENVEKDCRNNAKDWYWTIGKDLSVNYTTLSSEGYSEAYSNKSRNNQDYFYLAFTTRLICNLAIVATSVNVKTKE